MCVSVVESVSSEGDGSVDSAVAASIHPVGLVSDASVVDDKQGPMGLGSGV